MASIIPNNPIGRRIVCELIYGLRPGAHTFNMGIIPVQPDISEDRVGRKQPRQIQLYAELLRLLPYETADWPRISVLEVAAAGGGGLYYLQKRYRPLEAIGIELSTIAAWRGRRLGSTSDRARPVDCRLKPAGSIV